MYHGETLLDEEFRFAGWKGNKICMGLTPTPETSEIWLVMQATRAVCTTAGTTPSSSLSTTSPAEMKGISFTP